MISLIKILSEVQRINYKFELQFRKGEYFFAYYFNIEHDGKQYQLFASDYVSQDDIAINISDSYSLKALIEFCAEKNIPCDKNNNLDVLIPKEYFNIPE